MKYLIFVLALIICNSCSSINNIDNFSIIVNSETTINMIKGDEKPLLFDINLGNNKNRLNGKLKVKSKNPDILNINNGDMLLSDLIKNSTKSEVKMGNITIENKYKPFKKPTIIALKEGITDVDISYLELKKTIKVIISEK